MLSALEIEQFHRDGFLIMRAMFQGRELDELRQAADAVVAEGVAGKGKDHLYHPRPDGTKVYFRSERMWDRGDIFMAATVKPELLAAIGQCSGHPFFPFNDSFVCKLPHGDVPILWHQDPPYWNPKLAESCPIPNFDTDIYLDHSTIANGCVWAIPGHHLVGHVELSKFTQEELFARAVPIEMQPGDVLFHTISGPHGSVGNKTADIRRIFYVHYLPQEAFEIDYGKEPWAKEKSPASREHRQRIAQMLAVRQKLGLEGLEVSKVRWSEKGFEFTGAPITPPYHWRALAATIPEAKKARMRKLADVEGRV